MDEEKEEWDENKPDPTKEAFFSDLLEMEEEIAAEGYEVVVHAINLINSHYYDDAIETLRQAIGIYSQIERTAEISAIEQKISEIYLLKEQSFIEDQVKATKSEMTDEKIASSVEQIQIEEPELKISSLSEIAQKLIKQAQELEEIEEFDDAIEKYDEALNIYNDISDNDMISELELLIGNCYLKKEAFLKRSEIPQTINEPIPQSELELTSESSLEKVSEQELDAKKKKERHLSDLAYKLIMKASQNAKMEDFKSAIEFYEEASILFSQLNWGHEIAKIEKALDEIKRVKASLNVEKPKIEPEAIPLEETTIEEIEESTKIESPPLDQEILLPMEEERIQSALEAESKKQEDRIFEEKISKMVESIEKKVREYETALRKDVKTALDTIEAPYQEAIKIYSDIKQMLIERGWNDLIEPYMNQIKIYHQKLEKDENLRVIEEKKILREREIEEMHKTNVSIEDINQQSDLPEYKPLVREEDFSIENSVNELLDKVQKMDRNYELELKKGNFVACPYPEIIDIYQTIQKMFVEKGLNQAASIYNNPIRLYKEKIQKDNKLREIQDQKIQNDAKKEQEEIKTMENIEAHLAEFEKKMDVLEKMRKEEAEEQDFNSKIDEMVRQIEKMDREYTLALKKKNFIERPYEKIIEIYRNIQQLLKEKGLEQQALAYHGSIKHYKTKIEQDNKLRQIEARKAQRDKEFAESYRVQSQVKQPVVEKQVVNKVFEREKAEKAMKLIDEAETNAKLYEASLKKDILSLESPFDGIISNYREARRIFLDIHWTEEANRLITTIKFYKDKKKRDERLRKLEMQKVEQSNAQQRQLERRRQELEKLEIERKKKEEIEFQEQKQREKREKRDKALLLMDQGKRELVQGNYHVAISLYEESEVILREIEWKEGISMVKESILAIKEKIKKLERENKLKQQIQERKEKVKNQLDDHLQKVKERNILEEENKRNIILQKQREKVQEKEISDEAYALLEKGTELLNKKQFKEATEKYINARDLFKNIGWQLEVSRINSDLLLKVMREQKRYEKLILLRQKTTREKRQRNELLKQSKTAPKESIKKTKVFESNTEEGLEVAYSAIDNLKYNEAILILKKLIEVFKGQNRHTEVIRLKKLISDLNTKSLVPIITIKTPENNENLDKFEDAYKALDRANISLYRNRTMKAVSQLIEAKYNLESIKLPKNEEFLQNINDLIKKYKKRMGEETENVISETKVIDKEEDSISGDLLKERIEARRSEREKRIRELLKGNKKE
ncbi:MAG: hypothetical protein JW891_11465 [Candidatus Lokiarchaeota archaeon]|nr:hypothetical protein [Candidatus Lokiarchaeota archaeon]